jgi:hypothetical protein
MPTSVNSTYTGPIPGAYSASPLAQIAGLGSVLGAVSNTKLGGTIGSGLGSLWDYFAKGGTGPEPVLDFTGGDTTGNIIYDTDGGYTTSGGTTVDPNEYSGGM